VPWPSNCTLKPPKDCESRRLSEPSDCNQARRERSSGSALTRLA
jgi:hypothetical protein